MKKYVYLNKDNEVIGVSREQDNNNNYQTILPDIDKKIEINSKNVSIYLSKEFTKYEFKNNKIVGKKGYEKKPTKSLRNEIDELKEEIKSLKNQLNSKNKE